MSREALQKDIDFYEQSRPSLLEHHKGKFVVIYEAKFIGAFDTFDNAAKYAVSHFGKGPYLIRQVGKDGPSVLPASVVFRHNLCL